MFCPYCGKALPDDSMFCDACGNSLAAVQDAPQAQPVQQSTQQPQFQQPLQQPQQQYQQPVQQYQPPKKNRTGLIAAIAGVVVLGVLAVVLIPRLGAGKDDVVANDEPNTTEEREEKPSGSSARPRDEEKKDDDKPAFEPTPITPTQPEPEVEPEPEPEPEPELVAWIDEQDIRISRKRSVSFTTAINDGEQDIGEINVVCNVDFGDWNDDLPEGYKRVMCFMTSDVSESLGKGGGFLADGVFDRYTGTVFEFEEGVPASAESPDREGFARIEYGEKTWDIAVETLIDSDMDDDGNLFVYKSIIVTCPEDYDGAVFYVGYDDMELNGAYEKLNFTKRLYTFDRLPFLGSGHDYYYFTESNR